MVVITIWVAIREAPSQGPLSGIFFSSITYVHTPFKGKDCSQVSLWEIWGQWINEHLLPMGAMFWGFSEVPILSIGILVFIGFDFL